MSSTSALRHVFVGGYTAESDGNAPGLISLLNERSAKHVRLDVTSTMGLVSPTWLTRHPELPVLIVTSETDPGTLNSLRWNDEGRLSLLSTVETVGGGGCHAALTPDARFAIVASYRSGALTVIGVAENGTLSGVTDSMTFTGSGPHPNQAAPHAHQTAFDGDELLVCDLGTDQIHRLRLDPNGKLSRAADPIRLPAGSGPRHLVVVEDHLAVACELSGQVWLGARQDDGWRQAQVVASSARDGHIQPSGIQAGGTRVYVANRGVDTIGVFDLDPAASELTQAAEFDCGGAWPRAISLDGGLLWVCNERSDTITVFEVSPMPPAGPVAELALGTPTCVALIHDQDSEATEESDA